MNSKLFYIQGKLKVRARGYWFTGGGAKGPFGYYPHLKDENGLPVYPDTQVKGDLRMAAEWLKSLGHCTDKDLVTRVFGRENDSASSLLYLSDLELTSQDRTVHPADIFQVKPRIKIDENTGTVQKNMLVNREMAFLEGRVLESELFLGLFREPEEMEKAKDLLDRAVKLLSGFGAFRSRGYGMGRLRIEWSDPEEISFSSFEQDIPDKLNVVYQTRTHLRSKPIGQGSAQTVEGLDYITPEQFRAWFVKAYYQLFGSWPSLEDMGMLSFSALCPAWFDEQSKSAPQAGFIPPMTTLRRQKVDVDSWEVKDVFNHKQDHKDMVADPDDDSGLYYGKQKTMARGWYVTGEEKPSAYRIRIMARSRNSMDDKFTTTENGLFVQEYISRGTRFSCTVSITRPESDFGGKAYFIIKNIPVLIKGCVFEAGKITPDKQTDAASEQPGPFLVTRPIAFNDNFMSQNSNSIKLSSVAGYNSTLKRARRNRISIMPGSVLNREESGHTMAWAGFGNQVEYNKPEPPPNNGRDHGRQPSENKYFLSGLEKTLTVKSMSRSQAGFLRSLLELDNERINNILNERGEKFQDKDNDLKIIYKSITDKKTFEEKKAHIQAILEHMQVLWWKDKQKRMQDECNK
ncbi:RAMP superfamily CRISPR-associated protein [Desulfonatronovibrio hydrogenovorans]|uniref:RAMP superfamily CRISPR-associated protein n=1 Tax=Desulfonatronovibrio hydrogenovorans TaxID=53245 RepID=UPI000492118B|nr:RAMP superfamily CRISPR-associated protein [Desulfonatronovibrio hydrogenovorans]